MAELSNEDALRINVLLAGEVEAIRIDESAMIVHGLGPAGEARITLNPTCRDEHYLRLVRETLSSHVLGSPGGYPVYLKRWSRMGQAKDTRLADLLKLGEPEAVSAVVHAPGLTEVLARRAWWAAPSPENARSMLGCEAVVQGTLGSDLADYLFEYLPFESEAEAVVQGVRLILQPGLLDPHRRQLLWRSGARNAAYYVGFLLANPGDLPEDALARGDLEAHRPALQTLFDEGNVYADGLLRLLSGPGQAFLRTAEQALRRPPDQDVLLLALDAVADHLSPVRSAGDTEADFDGVLAVVDALLSSGGADGALRRLQATVPALEAELRAMLILARLGYPVVRPVLAQTTAVGPLLRRKLAPVMDRVFEHFRVLQGSRD